MSGALVISLDFEKMWGVRDVKNVGQYLPNLYGVQEAIPAILSLFTQYQVHATFATVGFLFAKDKYELKRQIPAVKPTYNKPHLSPYIHHIDTVGENEKTDPLHFGWSLIEQIINTPNQELACHTFSHYYCLETGQTIEQFKADIDAACAIAAENNIKLESLVFPRNQFNAACIAIIAKRDFYAYRGNESSWLYQARTGESESNWRRAGRLMDSYFNLSGHNSYSWNELAGSRKPYNIPSSRFLRPFNKKMRFAEARRLRRILTDMTFAAKNNRIYHLWWHPHNFGKDLKENLNFLERIFQHYIYLENQYGFLSYTMKEVAEKLEEFAYGQQR